MAKTIELLETIGKDATLRHASASDLENLLDDMRASDELKRAALMGDIAPIKLELGEKSMGVNDTPINGGCDEEEGEGAEEPHDDDGDE